METWHYAFFQNRECERFPCHAGVAEEDFNCLFCYCPLYALGEGCGGDFTYTERGIKSCSGCAFPHRRENYGAVLARFPELAALARRGFSYRTARAALACAGQGAQPGEP